MDSPGGLPSSNGCCQSRRRDTRVSHGGDRVNLPEPGALVRVGSDNGSDSAQQGASPCHYMWEQRDQFTARPSPVGAGRPRRPAARDGRGDHADAGVDLARRGTDPQERACLPVRTAQAAATVPLRQPPLTQPVGAPPTPDSARAITPSRRSAAPRSPVTPRARGGASVCSPSARTVPLQRCRPLTTRQGEPAARQDGGERLFAAPGVPADGQRHEHHQEQQAPQQRARHRFGRRPGRVGVR